MDTLPGPQPRRQPLRRDRALDSLAPDPFRAALEREQNRALAFNGQPWAKPGPPRNFCACGRPMRLEERGRGADGFRTWGLRCTSCGTWR